MKRDQQSHRGCQMRRMISILFIFVAVLALTGELTGGSVSAQTACDFVTGGGFIIPDPSTGAHGNFGVAGGCKNNGPNAPFWGHLEYLDHGSYPPGSTATVPPPFRV